ncbi:MAG: RsmG family class I SAM-dependent methyltransferase [Planctomycetota bacterium]|nr:class I SAM-dependent methyltransferase [Planctomycetota bacterium]MDW8372744.1 RsmG family class I SAM-dependent methyltransferase [Planctomycetota bacterium]
MPSRERSAAVPGAGSVDPADHPPLPLPDADWDWLRERCAALGLPDPAPWRETLAALYGHLVGVNRWLNLTTVTSPRDWLKWHVLDSWSGLRAAALRAVQSGALAVDLGSGGGYPGLPLALALPHLRWLLIDARRKKAEFLGAAARLLGPWVGARHLRGDCVPHAAPELHRACQLVVNRAMGPADAVLPQAAPLLAEGGLLVVWKGPAFLGSERDRAAGVAPRWGFRVADVTGLRLEDGDPERYLVTYRRVGGR